MRAVQLATCTVSSDWSTGVPALLKVTTSLHRLDCVDLAPPRPGNAIGGSADLRAGCAEEPEVEGPRLVDGAQVRELHRGRRRVRHRAPGVPATLRPGRARGTSKSLRSVICVPVALIRIIAPPRIQAHMEKPATNLSAPRLLTSNSCCRMRVSPSTAERKPTLTTAERMRSMMRIRALGDSADSRSDS